MSHAYAGIGDLDRYRLSRPQSGLQADPFLSHNGIHCLDGQLAAAAQGVACVDSQVYERLLHLSWVHFDRTRVGGSLQNQVHMLSTSGAMD